MSALFYDPKFVNFIYFVCGMGVGVFIAWLNSRPALIKESLWTRSYLLLENYQLDTERATSIFEGWDRYLESMKGEAQYIVADEDEALDLMVAHKENTAADDGDDVLKEFNTALFQGRTSYKGVPVRVERA